MRHHDHEHETCCCRCGHTHQPASHENCKPEIAAATRADGGTSFCKMHESSDEDDPPHHSHEHCGEDCAHSDSCSCGSVSRYIQGDSKKKSIFTLHNFITLAGLILFIFSILFKSENRWIALVQFLVPYLLIGYRVLFSCAKNILHGKIFDENFLMTLATVGAFVLGEYLEAVAVMIFFEIGERFQDYAVQRSVARVKSTLNMIPDAANRLENGTVISVRPADLSLSDLILIRVGERVPVDAVITEGSTSFDTSSLTGESVPREYGEGSEILSGFINTQTAVQARVTKRLEQSTASKIMDMVQSATEKKAKSEKFITKFARIYTPIVTGAALFIAFLLPLITGQPYMTHFKTALFFLIVSCPCALVISIPLSFFAAIGTSAKMGALFKGSSYLSTLYGTDTVIFDKTGTLTQGSFDVDEIVSESELTSEEILENIALGESQSNHPIAKSVMKRYGKEVPLTLLQNYSEAAGGGVSLVGKGRSILIGKASFLQQNGIVFSPDSLAHTAVYLAVDGQYKGYLTLRDRVKEDSGSALSWLKAAGVKRLVMLTGDGRKVAEKIAAELSIDTVFSEMLPQQKLEIVEKLVSQNGHKTAYVGDGINDVLALSRSDIGVSVGSTADAAIESADIVIPGDSLVPLAHAKRIARKTHHIVIQNVVVSLAVKIAIVTLSFFFPFPLFVAILGDVGCSLLTVANALRLMRYGKNKKADK